ncbi:MAG: hydrogenase expression/formation protein HypE [Nitrospirae bacterium]|nr:hydrogenase expression/formation protein HypE [Nitrospirota bacterium]
MDKILLSHGGGGLETWRLIKDLFFKRFSNPVLLSAEDSAVLKINSQIAFTTDSFTVNPIFFKGGSIGKLAVAGTVNDLAVMGAKPLYLSAGFIIEEGLLYSELEEIVKDMADEAEKTGVVIATGDTKVVPKGAADKIFINTSGIGEIVYDGISASNIKDGDAIIISGTTGDHGACIMAVREGINFEADIESDCRGMWDLVSDVINSGVIIHAMRDPTRGGLSAVLNEWAVQSDICLEVYEDSIPVKPPVRGLCELLGFEPYHLACEGRVVFAVSGADADKALTVLKNHPAGRGSAIVGRATMYKKGSVILKTSWGSSRIMDPPAGELLPRIC